MASYAPAELKALRLEPIVSDNLLIKVANLEGAVMYCRLWKIRRSADDEHRVCLDVSIPLKDTSAAVLTMVDEFVTAIKTNKA